MNCSLACVSLIDGPGDFVKSAGESLSVAPTFLQKLEELLHLGFLDGLRLGSSRQGASPIICQVDGIKEPNDVWGLARKFVGDVHQVLERTRDPDCLESFLNGGLLVRRRSEKVQKLNAEYCILQLGIGQGGGNQGSGILPPLISQRLLSLLPGGDSCGCEDCRDTPNSLRPGWEINGFELGMASPRVEDGPARQDPKTKCESTQHQYVSAGQFAVCHDISQF